jgi:hypothetical protein
MSLRLHSRIRRFSRSAVIVLVTLGVFANSSNLLAQSNQVSNSVLAAESEDNSIDFPAIPGRTLAITLFSDTRGVEFGPYLRQLIHTL